MRSGKKNTNQYLQRNFEDIVFQLSNAIVINIFNQISIEILIRNVKEKKAMRLLQQVIKNNEIILNLQKQIIILERENTEKIRRRKQQKEWLRKEYKER